ncbi:MAG: 5-demethoxyubiquinol-8 5-hydroxylase UbiM [Alphaproteobacteria bacterium]
MSSNQSAYDVVVAGGGPVGLAFAASLARSAPHALSIAVVERQPMTALAAPAFDGREIALTHRSQHLLDRLGAWHHLPEGDTAPLRTAQVRNGEGRAALHFAPPDDGPDVLGRLVPNHRIRAAMHAVAAKTAGIDLLTDATVTALHDGAVATTVALADGRRLEARLLVAADSRLSPVRRMRGIGAARRDFGRSMMVCRVTHEAAHGASAVEWFGYGQTLAMLPLRGRMSSAVVTLPPPEIAALMAMDETACGAALTERAGGRLGRMHLASTRHAYPLVATYADRFAGRRFAAIGDAAVGMHPVTAHGFNFGLAGQDLLARSIAEAMRRGRDVADAGALVRYEREHRRATRPLYLATNATALLYTTDTPPARLLRDAVLACGALPPVRRAIVAHLMDRTAEALPPQAISAAR